MREKPSLAELAGVTLNQPQATYALMKSSIGRAVITRKDPTAGLRSGGAITIEVSREARDKILASAVEASDISNAATNDRTATTARFDLFYWSQASRHRDVSGSEAWRDLITTGGLFSHPELLFAETGAAHALLASACTAALADLRTRLNEFIESPKKAGYYTVACDACTEARQQAAALAQMQWSAKQRAERRWKTSHLAGNCVHEPLARASMWALFEAHPELAFEAIGLIEPARSGDNGCENEPPTRFMLTESVLKAILGHWLLGAAPSSWNPHSYEHYWNERQKHRKTYCAARHATTVTSSGVTPEERSALSFAAIGWSIDTPVDELAAAWTRCEEASASPPTFVAETATTLAVRVLPEMTRVPDGGGKTTRAARPKSETKARAKTRG
jgi:hypothetical protein